MLSCRAWSLVSAINVSTKYCRYRKTIPREKRSIRVETSFIWKVECVEKLFISIRKATRCSWLGVLWFYVLWVGVRVGSSRVGSQNLDPRATLRQPSGQQLLRNFAGVDVLMYMKLWLLPFSVARNRSVIFSYGTVSYMYIRWIFPANWIVDYSH